MDNIKMSIVDTSDALDLTKENIKPLKRGRKPIQLETALQAQSNMEIQNQLNKDKDKYEQAIRTYEGEDPLGPRFEYIKWLEQVYLQHGPNSNLLPLIEETVQKFKNDVRYKQDLRFIQILINFIENQPNPVELYQTVYNQELGTKCAIFYKAWADLLDRCNDFKRVDQIFLLGIQYKAQPIEDLEQAHLQFQLSIARRMLNGQLSNDEDKNTDYGRRNVLSVLKKSEIHSGVRHGFGGSVGKLTQINNVNNGKMTELQVFEDNNENGLFGIDDKVISNSELAPKGLNKENTLNPGPWTKPKKSRSKLPKPVSTVNFEVHQDNNVECIPKLAGIKVPNALRNIKKNANISCPVAIFEPLDPTKKPMYCKDKVYAAGRDVQIEELRYEIYLKKEKEKEKNLEDSKRQSSLNSHKEFPLKKVFLPEDNLNTNDFKVPNPLRVEPDTLSQSVTVNTRVAIDLVQQMWNSPSIDNSEEPAKVISKDIKPIVLKEFKEDKVDSGSSSNFVVYEDNLQLNSVKSTVNIQTSEKQKDSIRNASNFYVYTDEDNEAKDLNKCSSDVYVDSVENQDKNNRKPNASTNDENIVYANKSHFKKVENTEITDDLTCSTKAFAFLLTSSTPLTHTKTNNGIVNQSESSKLVQKKDDETNEFQLAKNLSMILEASKERNSSSLSGILPTLPSDTKLEQSMIDLGDTNNPFDDILISKLLQNVIKFPTKRHSSGFIEHNVDLPSIRSEFKLGEQKMSFLGELGKGSYGRVVKVRSDDTYTEKAFKIQKPECSWEWYISKEIEHRLKDSKKLSYFINMDKIHMFKNGSIISMEYSNYGTLLSMILAFKETYNRSIPTPLAALLTRQITSAVKYLHECQIIHADLKPDNVIIKSIPSNVIAPCVQLIDFGRSIDMTLFPQHTTFTYSMKTVDSICHEMRDKLPWTYQIDYYGLAGIFYMVLMSDYMKTQKLRKLWMLSKPLPRYIDKTLWCGIMNSLLNIESCTNLPNLEEIIDKLNKYLKSQQNVVLNHNFETLRKALNKR